MQKGRPTKPETIQAAKRVIVDGLKIKDAAEEAGVGYPSVRVLVKSIREGKREAPWK